MRIKKLLAALTVSSMLCTGLAGCGKKAPDTNPSLPPIVSTEGQTETEEPETKAPATEAQTEEPETEARTEAQTESAPPAESSQPASAKTMAPGEIWYVGTNVNNQLNVRAQADAGSEKVGELYVDEEARIEEAPANGWVRIFSSSTNGAVTGYVKTDFLSPSKSDASPDSPPEAPPAPPAEPQNSQPAASTGTNGHTVCIDAGHQQHGISETEPNAPGSTVMKAKLTTGTQGAATGLTEYQLNLDVSLKLAAELQARGYSVVMIRTTNDCPVSNAERAQIANSSGAEIFVRVHANSSDNPEVRGAMFYAPSPANPYLSQELIAASNALANTMLNAFCTTTGIQNRGLIQDDGMTGINWCAIPVTIAEMGFMSNPDEDRLMADPAFQTTMAQGLANGIDAYFGITR